MDLKDDPPCTSSLMPAVYDVLSNPRKHTEILQTAPTSSTRREVVKFILVFAGMFLYVVDVFSDVWQSVTFFVSGEIIYGAVTLTFVVLSYLITASMGLYYYIQRYNREKEQSKADPSHENREEHQLTAHLSVWFCRILSTILMLGPVTRDVEQLYNCIRFHKASKKTDKDKYNKRMDEHAAVNCMLRGFEACFEAAPQLTFQLYVLLITKPQLENTFDLVRWLTILSSWFSLAVALTSFYAFIRQRDRKPDTSPMELRHKPFYLLWRLPETAVRVLSIACFASVFKYKVLAILIPHFVIMIGWQWLLDKKKKKRVSAILYFVFGFVDLFVFFDKYGGRNFRLRCIAFYTLFYAENFTMLLLWYFYTPDQTAWFHNVILIVGCVLLPLHVLLESFYFMCCHPDSKKQEASGRDSDYCSWKTWREALFENTNK